MPCQSLGMSELWEHWEARVAEETKTAGRAAPGKREDQQTRGTESQQEVHSLQEQLWCVSKYCLELPNMKDKKQQSKPSVEASVTCTGVSVTPENVPE